MWGTDIDTNGISSVLIEIEQRERLIHFMININEFFAILNIQTPEINLFLLNLTQLMQIHRILIYLV